MKKRRSRQRLSKIDNAIKQNQNDNKRKNTEFY